MLFDILGITRRPALWELSDLGGHRGPALWELSDLGGHRGGFSTSWRDRTFFILAMLRR